MKLQYVGNTPFCNLTWRYGNTKWYLAKQLFGLAVKDPKPAFFIAWWDGGERWNTYSFSTAKQAYDYLKSIPFIQNG